MEDIICGIEYGIRGLPNNKKYVIRKDYAIFLRKDKPLQRNISKPDFKVVKILNNIPNIFILKCDKGGVVVILDREEYHRKILDHLCNSGSYKNNSKNPLKSL